MSGGHLRPHPTQISDSRNISKKMELRTNPNYFFAFNPDDYCDFMIRNKESGDVIVYPGLRAAMAHSELPVVFFTCYDVGDNETLGVFVRHVVCCVADTKESTVYFFDMRNLRQISNDMKVTLEFEFSKLAGKPMQLLNSACVERTKCIYLQRFKGDHEMGWCIAWALLFLKYLCDHSEFAKMNKAGKTKHIAQMYLDIDKKLSVSKSNHFIEKFYIKQMGF